MFVEGLSVFSIVFIGCGFIRLMPFWPAVMKPYMIPYAFMAAVMFGVFVVAKNSGAHLNPSVTIALCLVRWFPWAEALPYVLSHFAGGILATLLLWILIPGGTSFGPTVPAIPPAAACLREALIMSVFLFAILVVMIKLPPRVRVAAFAAVFLTMVYTASSYGTGLSLNPARSLGPNLMHGRYDVLWIYFIGPTVGSWIAFAAFKFLDERVWTPLSVRYQTASSRPRKES